MNLFYVTLYWLASFASQILTAWGTGVMMQHQSLGWWIVVLPLLILHGYAFQRNREHVAKKILGRE